MNVLLCKGVLSKHLPETLVNKIIYLLLSYGTPGASIVRDYIQQTMHKLPEQFDDNIRTIWRYHAYSSQYSFLRYDGLFPRGVEYQTNVRYETILALIESEDCLVALRPQNAIRDLKKFIKFTLRKLFEIRLHLVKNTGSEKCGTPSALLMKKHWKDVKKNEFLNEFV